MLEVGSRRQQDLPTLEIRFDAEMQVKENGK